MSTLLHTKKVLYDTYGEVPPMVAFLGIDTDQGAYDKWLLASDGTQIRLDPSEQMKISVSNPRNIYNVNRDRFGWLPDENLGALTTLTRGAGQIRTNGRFALTCHYREVFGKVQSELNVIRSANIIDNGKYQLLGHETEIQMVFSLCGGTGCGTFINMAYLLRKAAPDCKLAGYAVLPDVFKAMSATAMTKVVPNAYGAIMDLDYLMGMGIGSQPVTIGYINDRDDYGADGRPFDSIVFIDNKNNYDYAYTHVDQLTEMVSLALVTAVGELSSASASIVDNAAKIIDAGDMNIEDKKAWVAGMGISEILFKGDDIAKCYSIKAASIMIGMLLEYSGDASSKVNGWIDSPEVHIRENNNHDDVIDFLYDKAPRYQFSTIDDYNNPQPEVDAYLESVKVDRRRIEGNVSTLLDRVRKRLDDLADRIVNDIGGLGEAAAVLTGILNQINVFHGEMVKEKADEDQIIPVAKQALKSAIDDLKGESGGLFSTKDKKQKKAAEVTEKGWQLARHEIESERRSAAINFFVGLQNTLNEYLAKIATATKNFRSVRGNLDLKIAGMQNRAGVTFAAFQIDLASDVIGSIEVNRDELQIKAMSAMLPCPGHVLGAGGLTPTQLESAVLSYTDALSGTSNWREKSIENVLGGMSDKEFRGLMEKAINKSLPLFKYDYRGYVPVAQPVDSYYIGVPDKNASRVTKDSFMSMLEDSSTTNVEVASIGATDRIVIYRQVGVVPAYAIGPLAGYEPEYAQCSRAVDCHFDKIMEDRMRREGFSLTPSRASDDDLVKVWVWGFVLGLLKNEEGRYYIKTNDEEDALDDFWHELAQYRDEAFEAFKRSRDRYEQYLIGVIETEHQRRGQDAMKELVADVKANYWERYSQIGMTREQLKQREYSAIGELFKKERVMVNNM